MNNKLYQTEKIHSKDDFVNFLKLFLDEYHENFKHWENHTLESFLQAMLSWTDDADGYYQNIGIPEIVNNPSWRLFTDMLMASTMYE